jgi:hypothetical protein
MRAGEFVALLVTVMLPVNVPEAGAVKVTCIAAFCPGARTRPDVMPLVANPTPVIRTLEMVTFEFPAFTSVTPRALVSPAGKDPKLKLDALVLSRA